MLFSACKDSLKEKRIKILSENGKTYWRVINSDAPGDTSGGELFLENGTTIGYDISKSLKRRILNRNAEIHADIEFAEDVWSLPNDSTMKFGSDLHYKIIYFNKDSFRLKPLDTIFHWELIYYKEKDQISPIDTTIPAPIFPGI